MIISKTNMETNWDYYSDNESLVYKIKTENVFEHFSKNKEMFEFTNDSARSK